MTNLRVHYLQNDPLATLGFIEEWLIEQGYPKTCTRMFENERLPSMNDFDLLIILGGRMGAYEEIDFPWLAKEKGFIKAAIHEGKWILGICLGAQLTANVLGSNVYPHVSQEIGWWEIELEEAAKTSPLFNGIPKKFTIFEYHGDTFDLPKGATRLASNEGCRNQAFSYGERVIGLQFHPEFTENMIGEMKEKLGPQLSHGKYIQEQSNWVHQTSSIDGAKSILMTLLNNFAASAELET